MIRGGVAMRRGEFCWTRIVARGWLRDADGEKEAWIGAGSYGLVWVVVVEAEVEDWGFDEPVGLDGEDMEVVQGVSVKFRRLM